MPQFPLDGNAIAHSTAQYSKCWQ